MNLYDLGPLPINRIPKNNSFDRKVAQLSNQRLKQMESTLNVAKEYDSALKFAKRYTIAYNVMVGAFLSCFTLAPLALLIGNKIAASKLTKLTNPVENVVSPINIKQAQAELKNTFVCAPDALKTGIAKAAKVIK